MPSPGDPQSLNRYAYVRNNPLKYTDPSGHRWVSSGPDDIIDERTIGSQYGGPYEPLFTPSEQNAMADQAFATVMDFAPGVGDAKGFIEAFTGSDLVTGESLGNWRYLGLLGISELRHLDETADVLRVASRRFSGVGEEVIPRILKVFGDTGPDLAEVPRVFRGRRITTIGRWPDTQVAEEMGERILNIPGWSLGKNFDWISDAIANGDVIYLASPVTRESLSGLPKYGGITVLARELDTFLQAGYRRAGVYLVPPH